MYIEELKGGEELESEEEEKLLVVEEGVGGGVLLSGSKRVLVGAGARVLFYPTLLYNVVRNKFQAEFRWWDQIDEFLLLGAVPFPSDVKRLRDIGVWGVVTLNEPYETLVPTSLYEGHGIDHLVLPTRDYLFAPSIDDIRQAVDFIHENALHRRTTYVHCKAGRGRSTTIVICYLVQHKRMLPDAAYAYVKSIRPRVLLASAQWQAVQEYYHLKVKKTCGSRNTWSSSSSYNPMRISRPLSFVSSTNVFAFDDGSVVLVSEADVDGYDPNHESGAVGGNMWGDLSLVYRVRVAGQSALAKLSYLWLRYETHKISRDKMLEGSSCLTKADKVANVSVDIHIY